MSVENFDNVARRGDKLQWSKDSALGNIASHRRHLLLPSSSAIRPMGSNRRHLALLAKSATSRDTYLRISGIVEEIGIRPVLRTTEKTRLSSSYSRMPPNTPPPHAKAWIAGRAPQILPLPRRKLCHQSCVCVLGSVILCVCRITANVYQPISLKLGGYD